MAKKRRANSAAARGTAVSITAGAVGILLAVWLVYGTVTIDPFRWGVFVEELILAFCVLFALRLLCVVRLPDWISIVCIVLIPAGYFLYAQFALTGGTASPERSACLAASAAFALCTARELDAKPDGTLLAALLAAACLPVLAGGGTTFLTELMRALLMAGVFMAVLAVRQKSSLYLYFAALGFALGGAANLYAAFTGAGAGLGAVLFAPKNSVAAGCLPRCSRWCCRLLSGLLRRMFLCCRSRFIWKVQSLCRNMRKLCSRICCARSILGCCCSPSACFFHREDAVVPVLFSVAGGMLMSFFPFLNAPDVWLRALPLCVLAGVGTAKTARGKGDDPPSCIVKRERIYLR